MKGYKVTSVNDKTGRLYSATAGEKEEGMVEYKVDEWVGPLDGCGPLTAFATLEAAKVFMDTYYLSYKDYAIYTCECELSTHTRLWIKFYRPSVLSGKYPPGTLFAKRVMIKELVE